MERKWQVHLSHASSTLLLTKQISQLNSQISDIETRRFNPQQANDLRDKRDQLVLDLSSLASISLICKLGS